MNGPNQSSDLDASPDIEITNGLQLKNYFESRNIEKYLHLRVILITVMNMIIMSVRFKQHQY